MSEASPAGGGKARGRNKGPSRAEIQESIRRRRAELRDTLEEISVRVQPGIVAREARSRVASAMDRTAGKAYVAAGRTVSGMRTQLVRDDGAPRLDRLVPAAVLVVAAVGLLVVGSRRRRR
ncbi:DUF3618 domain-containing protein [Streptomyces aidingensis]|uniref:MYXO-CTERM domain-containing protein n=1 Tax=Streptomyces aidingensis TaxID=910347 RepID=A0A1I1RLZ5_9ACTN|nr:DUF3618 domain-containing protein [Streptomyces aidingensis]SFD33318.1 Protein of unknown function [Streptomyces aidingensis]